MFSSARMGRPAATRPISGRPIWSRSESLSWMPRDAPGRSSSTPLRCRARRCSSAALADRNPRASAISARVGGKPCSTRLSWMNLSTWRWRGVRSSTMEPPGPVCMYSYCAYIQSCLDAGKGTRPPSETRRGIGVQATSAHPAPRTREDGWQGLQVPESKFVSSASVSDDSHNDFAPSVCRRCAVRHTASLHLQSSTSLSNRLVSRRPAAQRTGINVHAGRQPHWLVRFQLPHRGKTQ